MIFFLDVFKTYISGWFYIDLVVEEVGVVQLASCSMGYEMEIGGIFLNIKESFGKYVGIFNRIGDGCCP